MEIKFISNLKEGAFESTKKIETPPIKTVIINGKVVSKG